MTHSQRVTQRFTQRTTNRSTGLLASRLALAAVAFAGLLVGGGNSFSYAQTQPTIDLRADTWAAVDGLGRVMPDQAEVGPVKQDQRRVVGIFYITWHLDRYAQRPGPYRNDVSKILTADPAARLDAQHPLWTGASYHWAEPEMGYFLSKDEWVIRRDMSMLADAGVDVLVMDVTNAVRYWDQWEVVFRVMQQMRDEGNRVPQFCFWAFNGPVITVVQELYERIYLPGKYRELWFHWDDKPLLLYNAHPFTDANGAVPEHPNLHFEAAAVDDPSHPHHGDPYYTEPFYKDYTPEVKRFFTLRNMWWGYYEWAGQRHVGTEDNWSFGYDLSDPRVRDLPPAKLVSTHRGRPEQAAVTPAQHPTTMVGKSWRRETGEPPLDEFDLPQPTRVPWLGQTVENPEAYGIYFQDRWDEAIAANPQFIYLNDWNEWTAGKYHPPEGQTFPFLGRPSPFYFVDQYNAEFNRGIQPMKGGYADNYYMQMVLNIRRYKGVRRVPAQTGLFPIDIDGNLEDWENVRPVYRDTVGDTLHRDYPGYHGLHYRDNSGRNDIVASRVAVDEQHVAFLAETRDTLTPSTGKNWMLLMIDVDQDHQTGWHGYDLLVNRQVVSDRRTTLWQWSVAETGGKWVQADELDFRSSGKALELKIPRRWFGSDPESLGFDFQWCDHPGDLNSPIDWCLHGDSAPNRRFNYRFLWRR